jgi:hypothetical protein
MNMNDMNVYRKLQEPFATVAEANAAIEKFLEELYELRVKHRLKDVLIAVESSVIYEDGAEGSPIAYAFYGDQTNAEKVAAYVFGRISGDRQEAISRAVERGLENTIKKPKSRR